MIFKTVYKKGEKYLVKILGLDPKADDKEVWATTTQKVHKWASEHFEDGDEVEIEHNVKNGQYFVTKIMGKGKGSSKNTTSSSESPSEYACEDCGKELKDDKYTKCYTCNKANPSKSHQKTCADCGAVLKNDKYDKCYNCNQKNPSTSSGKPDYKNGAPYGSLLPDEAKRRNKGICLNSACEAVKVMQGQVADAEALGEIVVTLAEKFYNKFFK